MKLTAQQRATAKALKGKTIARVVMNALGPSCGVDPITDPCIVFTDGTRLRFQVQEEPDGGEYGVALIY